MFWKKRKQEDEVFEKLRSILIDDREQLRLSGPQIFGMLSKMPKGDEAAAAINDMGALQQGQGIPTNGPIGTIAYLSRLRCLKSGRRIFFHRVAGVGRLDIYEYVDWSGEVWGFLSCNMYHSSKTTKAPEGFSLLPAGELLCGSNQFQQGFPFDFENVKRSHRDSGLVYLYAPRSDVADAVEKGSFSRPHDHEEMLKAITMTAEAVR